MDAKEMTGIRRHYHVVDCGEEKLRQLLGAIFTEQQQPAHIAYTAEGAVAAVSADAVSEYCEQCEPILPLAPGDYCQAVASGALGFFDRLTWDERRGMAGCRPTNTDDDPRAVGWRLDVHGREDGIVLVQIRPAWWS